MAPRAIFQHSLSAHAYICFLFIYFSIFQNNININININIHTYTYLLETLARQYICICLEKPADACRTSAEFTQAITASFPGIFIENCVVGLIWFSTYLVQHREHPYLASCSRLTGAAETSQSSSHEKIIDDHWVLKRGVTWEGEPDLENISTTRWRKNQPDGTRMCRQTCLQYYAISISIFDGSESWPPVGPRTS